MDTFEKHILVQYSETPMRSFYLKQPGYGRIQSCLLIESPEGIVICGDLCPQRNGVVSCYGKDLNWFSGELSRDYLCEKFFQKEWSLEETCLYLKRLDHSEYSDKTRKALSELLFEIDQYGAADSEINSEASFYSWYQDTFGDGPEDIGYEYPKNDADLLHGIQKAFSRLYWEQKQQTA